MKYVVFGAATTGIAIFGASLLFGFAGSLHIPTIARHMFVGTNGSPVGVGAQMLGGVLLVVALASVLFKISAVPMHFWCPDVFEGAPLSITTWLSTASKAAGVVLLVRIVWSIGCAVPHPSTLHVAIVWCVVAVSILTMLFGNIGALRQTSVRRMLAYSSIAHAGTMLAAAAIVPTSTWRDASIIGAVAQYIAIYAVMNVGAFVCVGLVARDADSERVDAFEGIGWRDPVTAVSMSMCLLSLVGLPPLGGFLAKFWVIAALSSAAAGVGTSTAIAHWVLIFAIVVNTAISLFYYAAIMRSMYFRKTNEPGTPLLAPISGKAALAGCALLLLLSGTLLIHVHKALADGATLACR